MQKTNKTALTKLFTIDKRQDKPAGNNGLLSMPPNSQLANPAHGGTAASQPSIKKNENHPSCVKYA